MKALFDSSVLVPALMEAHADHREAAAALDAVHGGTCRGVASTHVLAETWSSLTGMPVRPPLDPVEVWRSMKMAVMDRFEIVCLDTDDYGGVLDEMSRAGLRGGAVYDALHIRAARKAGVDEIWTYDVRDFRRLAPDLADRIRTP